VRSVVHKIHCRPHPFPSFLPLPSFLLTQLCPIMITCSWSSIHISRLIITAEPDTIREGKGEERESCPWDEAGTRKVSEARVIQG
jgi:hypothetical protein